MKSECVCKGSGYVAGGNMGVAFEWIKPCPNGCPFPSPSTKEAVSLGCTCPRLDNNNGEGVLLVDDSGEAYKSYWYSLDCKIHGGGNER